MNKKMLINNVTLRFKENEEDGYFLIIGQGIVITDSKGGHGIICFGTGASKIKKVRLGRDYVKVEFEEDSSQCWLNLSKFEKFSYY